MKKIYLFFLLLLSTTISLAQFNYSAASAQNLLGSYTDLGTSGTAISNNFTGMPMTFDDDNSSVQDIGFSFTYNGTVFTQFVLNTNGFIKLGNVAPIPDTYDVLPSPETNTIAAFNMDLDGGTAPEYRVFTTGAVGSRTCTIQYKNVIDFSFTTGQYTNTNFQIILTEGTNNIEFVYGTFTSSGTAPVILGATVGVKGSDAPTSVNATKPSSTAWSSATFINGPYPGNKLNNKNSVLPVPGVTFRFVAVVLPNNDAQVVTVYTLGQLPIPYGSPVVVQALIKNAGGATITNRVVTLNITGANTFTNSKMVTLIAGATTVVSFDPFSPTSVGTNTVTVSVPADDNNTNNTSSYTQVVNSNLFSYADASAAAGSLGYNVGAGLILAKYTVNGNVLVSNVLVHIFNTPTNTGNTVYGVVLNSAGTIVGQSPNYVITASDLGTYKNFAIPTPPGFSNTTFYVGLAQTANPTTGYFPVSFQNEGNPTRSGAYYTAPLIGGVAPVENTTIGRFMIQATISAALPVTLTTFDAQRIGSVNNLIWSTSQEINTSVFIIERSTDGRNFTQIGQVAAAGNSSIVRTYQFNDASPVKGINYYRLRIVDRDNSTKFSDIRSLRNSSKSDFAIYPNPVVDVMWVDINVEKSDKGVILITDINGKQVYSRQVDVTAGNNSVSIDISNMVRGAYIIKIQLSNDMIVKKFTKM